MRSATKRMGGWIALVGGAFITANLPASGGEAPKPPSTAARVVEETIHGTKVVDPYRWLEGDASGKMTPEVSAWTDAQNAYTRRVLDNLPGRAKLESRLRELMQVPSVSAPQMRRNRYFHLKREGTQNQAVLYVREGHAGQSRVLLDPNALDKSGLVTLAWYEASRDGQLLAFGTYRAGDENAVCRVLEVDGGKWLADEITGKVSDLQWLPDGTGFFYRRLADINNPYSSQIRFHRLGEHSSSDATLYEQHKEGPLATTWGPYARISEDARWLLLGYWTSTKANDLWVVDLDRWFRTREFMPVEIVKGADARSEGPINGDTLYLHTSLDAPNGRVVAVDLHNPARANWRDVIPHRDDAVIVNVSLARGMLAVEYRKNVASRIERFDLAGKAMGEVELPGIGSASLVTEPDRTEAFLAFASFNYPTTIFRVDLKSNERSLWARPPIPVDPSMIEVKQVFYPSKDGAKVSMFIVHKKGIALDGNNPTLLYGYGGFGIGVWPSFNATRFPWLEAGGVFAVANLRGGNEYGEAWHAAGMLARKQNVFDDFIAAGEWLIANRYTSPGKLAIEGGSNGGLLTGAALVQRPDLFAAVVCHVPLLDMLRYQNFLMARYWVPEYGSAENAEQFQFLLKYSPYQQVKQGVRYPAVLLTAGENDTRVHPLHARKMAARLQAATTSDKPVLLWVERDAGHGGGKPLSLRIRDIADSQSFLMWQLGMQP